MITFEPQCSWSHKPMLLAFKVLGVIIDMLTLDVSVLCANVEEKIDVSMGVADTQCDS